MSGAELARLVRDEVMVFNVIDKTGGGRGLKAAGLTHAGNRTRVFSREIPRDTPHGFVSQKSVELSFRLVKKQRGNETERGRQTNFLRQERR